jgi:hypothetical protein
MKDRSGLYAFASSKKFAHKRFLVYVLCTLFVLGGEISAQNFRQVHPGVEYAQVDYKIGDDPVKINLLRLDLKKVRLDVHHAMDASIGTETTSSIAHRKGAVAAINAGFFRLDASIYAGEAAGILQIDGQLLSESANDRAAIFIVNMRPYTEVYFGNPKTARTVSLAGSSFEIEGIDREPKDNELVMYTQRFHRTTLTGPTAVEVAVIGNKVHRVYRGNGSNPIPENGYVLSAKGQIGEKISSIVGRNLGVTIGWKDTGAPSPAEGSWVRAWGYVDITNGVSHLVRGGRIELTWEKEKASRAFAENRHPRTAVAKLKDGKFLMITVDGRQPGVSVGMNLQELAEYLLSLGAVDAMNLDGGGSTTMFLDGKVVNQPSDPNGERKVGDALIVTLRKK